MSDEEFDVKQVIVVRRDLSMRKGKLAAQVAHASMKFLIVNDESNRNDVIQTKLNEEEVEWLHGSHTKIVVGVDSEQELRDLVLKAKLADVEVHTVIDEGRTEFNGVATLTCAAFGPCLSSTLNPLTGHLKLL